MRDVVFEWYVPYVLSRKQQLVKAVMVSAALVFFVDAVFFAAAMLFPSVILAVTVFFLARSWRYEYEYVYVNGDFTISKIIRKAKRKDVYHASRTEFEEIIPGRMVKDHRTGAAGEGLHLRPAECPGLHREVQGGADLGGM